MRTVVGRHPRGRDLHRRRPRRHRRLGAAAPRRSPVRPATAQVRTTLYFGLSKQKGSVSELEWQTFLRDEVTARFPNGLTTWEADGQWRGSDGTIGHERAKVLLLVHPDTPQARRPCSR